MTNQRIDGARLWDTLMEYAQIGGTEKGGVKRITLTDEDRRGRDLFRAHCEAVGATVRVDSMGNMFARREGRDPNRLPVLMGSHLDSQPSGGKFDGAFGVLAGLEVLRTLNDLNITTEAPIELVNWTDEEGCRFGRAMMGSAVWSGISPEAAVKALQDEDGTTVGEALAAIGYVGAEPCAVFPADAMFELHIEQGPILEGARQQIGIVTGAQAQIWWEAEVLGQDSHAGTTPPMARRDALLTTARIIELVDTVMREEGDTSITDVGRGTVGRLAVFPNSPNVIPGQTKFKIEFRNPSDARIAEIAKTFPRTRRGPGGGQPHHADPDRGVPHSRPAFRSGMRRPRRTSGGKTRLLRPQNGLRRRSRRRACRNASPNRDDLHPLQGWAFA